MFVHSVVLPSLLISQALQACAQAAQAAQCITLAGGCDGLQAGEAAVKAAVSAFQKNMVYGGGDAVVFSSAARQGDGDSDGDGGDVLAMVAYSCKDGSVPPPMTGEAIQDM